VEIGTEAGQFPEKENINAIFVAVHATRGTPGKVKYSICTVCTFGYINKLERNKRERKSRIK
jgi:hypothetical protein